MQGSRIAGLDGLRGMAVAGVVAFHTGAPWAEGGYLGVSLFFTLSGFLIAGLLLRESERTGTVSLRAFWTRRFRRLWPAATLTVAGVLIANALLGRVPAYDLAGDSLAALGNVANWKFLVDGTSYQDLFQAPSPLLHFWSLAIEEQFYILFPLLATLCLQRSRRVLATAVGGLYAVSFAAQLLSASPDRVYLATDSRAGEILVGALLALWMESEPRPRDRQIRWWLVAASTPVAVATLAAWSAIPESTRAWELGGFAVVGIASCVLIVGARADHGPLSVALGVAPLRWLGTRSYAIYLFHWPIFVLWSPGADGRERVWEWLPRLALVAALAEASYHLVEMPIRRQQLWVRGWWRGVAAGTAGLAATMVAVLLTTTPPVDRFEQRADPAPFVAPTVTVPADPAPGGSSTTAALRPPRLAVIGDSTARAAADGLRDWADRSGEAWVWDLSMPGCPISEYDQFRQSPNERARERRDECRWRGRFAEWLGDYDPDVIVIIGGTSEAVDFETDDLGWTNILSTGGSAFVRSEITALVAELRAAAPAATIAMTTAPYNRWLMCRNPCFTHDDRRFDAYNAMVLRLAEAGVIDEVVPYAQHINEMGLEPDDPRRPDGVHLSEEGSAADARTWLGPTLLRLV